MSEVGNTAEVDAEVREESQHAEAVSPDSPAPPKAQPPTSEARDAPKPSDAQPVQGQPSASERPPAGEEGPLPPFKECYDILDSAQAKTFRDTIERLGGTLDRKCPGLASVLRSSDLTTTLGTYELQDGIAVKQQADLKREAGLAYFCLLAAGVVSGLILTVSKYVSPQTGLPGPWLNPANLFVLGLGILTLLLGAAAALFEYIARDQGRLNRWQASRSAAEVARLNVFSIIAEKAAAKGPKEALYGLAIVVRHLLDDQRTWLSRRAEKHRQSSVTTSVWGGFASALAFIGGSGAIIASRVPDTAPVVLAGVIGAAVGAFATNRESLRRDRANADRYEKTRIALDGIRGRSDDVVDKIRAGQKEAVVVFTQTVTDLLAAEHKQWLEGAAQAEAALEKLDEQLARLGGDSQTK
jgi:hypothetical protein